MKALFTYFRSNPDTKIKVVPHDWAKGVVILKVYQPKKILFFRLWQYVDGVGIEWPSCRGDLEKLVTETFFKYQTK